MGTILQGLTISAAALITCPLPGPAVTPTAGEPEAAEYAEELATWRRQRVESLTADDGWLPLIGLFWLSEGDNSFGSDPASDIVLPEDLAPATAGVISLEGKTLRLAAEPGAEILHLGEVVQELELASDGAEQPTILDLGELSFFVIERDGRYALRVRHRNHPARRSFAGIETFSVDLTWRLVGRFEIYEPPRELPIPTVLGNVSAQRSPGAVVFERDGQTLRLDALSAGPEGGLFLIFGDLTNGRTTYGGGRYLYTDPPHEEGRVTIDFNRAENPPCAFTPFATCLLPPRQNRLAVAVEAGERAHGGHHK